MGEELPDPAGDGGTLTAVGPGFSPASAGAQGGLDNPLGFDDELTEEDELVRQLAFADKLCGVRHRRCSALSRLACLGGSSWECTICTSFDQGRVAASSALPLDNGQHCSSCCCKRFELAAERTGSTLRECPHQRCPSCTGCLPAAHRAEGCEEVCICTSHKQCCLSYTVAHKAGCIPADQQVHVVVWRHIGCDAFLMPE